MYAADVVSKSGCQISVDKKTSTGPYDLDFSPSCPQNGSISYILRENFEVSATFLSGFTGANGADGQRKKGAVPECRLIEKAV